MVPETRVVLRLSGEGVSENCGLAEPRWKTPVRKKGVAGETDREWQREEEGERERGFAGAGKIEMLRGAERNRAFKGASKKLRPLDAGKRSCTLKDGRHDISTK